MILLQPNDRGRFHPGAAQNEKSFNGLQKSFHRRGEKASTICEKSYNRVNFLLLPSVCFATSIHAAMALFYDRGVTGDDEDDFLLQQPRFLLRVAMCFATSIHEAMVLQARRRVPAAFTD